MKKVISLLVAVLLMAALCVPLTAAPPVTDTAEFFELLEMRMPRVNSIDARVYVTSTVEVGGQVIELNGEGLMKQILIGHTNDEYEMSMDLFMNAGDETINTMVYYKDGVIYQNTGGVKSQVNAYLNDTGIYEMDLNLMAEAMETASVTAAPGGYLISFKIDGGTYNDMLQETMASAFAAVDAEGTEISFTDMYYGMTVDSKFSPVGYRMVYGATITDSDGEVAKVTYDITCRVRTLNTVTKIAYPADLEAYPAI